MRTARIDLEGRAGTLPVRNPSRAEKREKMYTFSALTSRLVVVDFGERKSLMARRLRVKTGGGESGG